MDAGLSVNHAPTAPTHSTPVVFVQLVANVKSKQLVPLLTLRDIDRLGTMRLPANNSERTKSHAEFQAVAQPLTPTTMWPALSVRPTRFGFVPPLHTLLDMFAPSAVLILLSQR